MLRQYQLDCMNAVLSKWDHHQKLLIQVATGGGKTVIMASIAKARLSKGPILLIAHREELLQQARDKFRFFNNIYPALEKADFHASKSDQVVVASIQTLLSRKDKWVNHFKTIFIDECHHVLAESYQSVLKDIVSHDTKVLGVTATADRADKKNLGSYFNDVAYEIGLLELIKLGYLCPIKAKYIPLQIDITNVSNTCGDYALGDLGNALNPYLESIAKSIANEAKDRKTLVFLPLIETSKRMTEFLRAAGLDALHVDGESSERRNILESFATKKTGVLCNSMLLTEGYDQPDISCVVCLRATKSRSLYSQMVGRGTRISPDKRDLLLLDFLWMTGKHSLIKPANLIASCDDEAKMMQKLIEDKGELDLQDAKQDAIKQREEALKAELNKRKKAKAGTIDPLEYGLLLHDSAIEEFEPTMDWHYLEVSDSQRKAISGFGIDSSLIENRGQASLILDRIFDRRKLGLATPRQIRLLTKLGHPSPNLISFNEASEFIDRRLSYAKKNQSTTNPF